VRFFSIIGYLFLTRRIVRNLEERRRINHQIRIPQIMVIDENGNSLGTMTPQEGRRIAEERSLDLVEVAPNARPPVCRIMDYGRFRYEQKKNQKKQQQVQTKILKLRPKTDNHDLETKLRHARRFLEAGHRVRFVVRMRGRERAVTDRWIAQLIELTDKLKDIGIATGKPALEGGGVTSTLEPRKSPLKEEGGDESSAVAHEDEDQELGEES
jgi:translation initiation factor IF-3